MFLLEVFEMVETQKGDNRKREFLLTALDLFSEKGYEKTTIQDIIDRMGVSKGAFYHYFNSKEDALITVAKNYVAEAIRMIKDISAREDISAVEKINALIESVNKYKSVREEERAKIKGVFNREENLKLERKIANSLKEKAIAYFKEIIDTGVKEGAIGDPVNSEELASFILHVLHSLNSCIDELNDELFNEENPLEAREFNEKLEEKLVFYEEMLSRILKIKKGSINLKPPYIRRFQRLEEVK